MTAFGTLLPVAAISGSVWLRRNRSFVGTMLVAGVTAQYGTADSDIVSVFGNGSIDTKGYGVGATLTWYGPRGFYVDGQAQVNWYDSDLESSILGTLIDNNEGKGEAFSVEVGKRTGVGGSLTITPQVQMIYSNVDFDRFIDPFATAVSAGRGDSLKTRWGLSVDHQTTSGEGARNTHLYGVVNLSYEWLEGTQADVAGTPVATIDDRLWGELGLGGSYRWNNRFALYTEVSANTALADFGAGYSLKGTAGFRMQF